MPDAQYFRAQAELCLQIACQMSDPKAAGKLRADAADYHARAAEAEAAQLGVSPTGSGGLATLPNSRQ
jgi:hypothetical protein